MEKRLSCNKRKISIVIFLSGDRCRSRRIYYYNIYGHDDVNDLINNKKKKSLSELLRGEK
jgi:hypothetical protein